MSKRDISIVIQKKVLSKEQQRFNALIRKLEKVELECSSTQMLGTAAMSQAADELVPIENQIEKADLHFHLAFDLASRTVKLSKKIRQGVDTYLLDKASEFMRAGLEDARSMYQYYSDRSFEEEKEELNDELREQFEMFNDLKGLGIDIPEGMDFSDTEQLMQLMAQMMEKAKMQDEENQAKTKKKTTPKSKKQVEKELEETELQKLKRGIYLELVKRYHPDKYPDKAEKEKANETMQRITAAFDADDLFALFKLQLELGTALQAHEIHNLAEKQLKSVNHSLELKLNALQSEINVMKSQMSDMFQMHFNRLTKEAIDLAFRRKKSQMLASLSKLEQNQRRCNDEKFIKIVAQEMAEEMQKDIDFFW
jgi:hypothetical protein